MFLTVHMPDGTTHRLEALDGWRVMEVIRDWGLPIKAECGGACACATCHVWVAEEWLSKLVPPSDEELEMLDGAFNVDERSRLCCQIIMTKELDGLEVELAPESLAETPQERLGSREPGPAAKHSRTREWWSRAPRIVIRSNQKWQTTVPDR